MNLDDAEVCLSFCGYEPVDGENLIWENKERQHILWKFADLDANWVHGTLIPALEELLDLDVVTYWLEGEKCLVQIRCEMRPFHSTGPTFEAAMISAAAKAIRGMSDE